MVYINELVSMYFNNLTRTGEGAEKTNEESSMRKTTPSETYTDQKSPSRWGGKEDEEERQTLAPSTAVQEA